MSTLDNTDLNTLIFQWLHFDSNRHSTGSDFVPNYDFILGLEHYLTIQNVHLDPSPHSLWFLMAGFLSNLLATHHVVETCMLHGGFIGYQQDHMTIFTVHKPSTITSQWYKLSIVNFAIDTSNKELAYNRRYLIGKISNDFPELTQTTIEEAMENARHVLIRRRPFGKMSHQSVYTDAGAKLPFIVEYKTRPLNVITNDNVVMGQFINQINTFGRLSSTKIQPDCFLPKKSNVAPEFLTSQVKFFQTELIGQRMHTMMMREPSPGDLIRFLQGATMNVEKTFKLFIMTRSMANGLINTLITMPKDKTSISGDYGNPVAYVAHGPFLRVDDEAFDIKNVIRSSFVLPHNCQTWTRNCMVVNVQVDKSEPQDSLDRTFDLMIDHDISMMPVSKNQRSVGDLLIKLCRSEYQAGKAFYLQALVEHLRIILDRYDSNDAVLKNYLIGQLSMTKADVFIFKPSDIYAGKFVTTFVVKFGTQQAVMLTIFDHKKTEAFKGALNTLGIPSIKLLETKKISDISLIMQVFLILISFLR